MSNKRFAVLVASSEFPSSGGRLPSLRTPSADVTGLRSVLERPDQFGFTHVHLLHNEPHHEVLNRINQVFFEADRDDLVLIYYSGHGKLALDGALYLTCRNTQVDLLLTTAVAVADIGRCSALSRCQRVVLILDCCYSGAGGGVFSKGTVDDSLQRLAQSEEGRGKFVITSSTALQISTAVDGDQYSLFTKHLIAGLGGKADLNHDGLISLQELFEYVRGEVISESSHSPLCWAVGATSTLLLGETPGGTDERRVREMVRRKLEALETIQVVPDFIFMRAREILDMSADEIRGHYRAQIELLTSLAENKITVAEFVDKWIKYKPDLPAIADRSSVNVEDRWELVRSVRRPILDLIMPAYLLSSQFRFLDWNPMFDEVVARPLGLVRGAHAGDFVVELANSAKVVERSQKVFRIGAAPLVDIEELQLETGKYGLIRFQKIAAQIPGNTGELRAWSVCLNVLYVKKAKRFWEDMARRLHREVNWSRYAAHYDKILRNFDEYCSLQDAVANMLGSARRCADLGAGTGNGALTVLKSRCDREVWAFESNENMIECLRTKISREVERKDTDRLRLIKGDFLPSLREFDEGFFDGAIMVNSLYAIDDNDKQPCLREVYRVLRPGGVLVLSTPHDQTDVKRLFDAIRNNLSKKGLYSELKTHVQDAYQRHLEMDAAIHKDTKDQTCQLIQAAGFKIEQIIDPAYVGAVIIVKAIRPLPQA